MVGYVPDVSRKSTLPSPAGQYAVAEPKYGKSFGKSSLGINHIARVQRPSPF